MGFLLVTRVGQSTRSPRVLAELAQIFLRAVVASNRVAMREAVARGRPLPPLYRSGIRYEIEPWGGKLEEFADVLTMLKRGWGDCDDLCGYRVAELQESGVNADARLYWRYFLRGKLIQDAALLKRIAQAGRMPPGVSMQMHCQVRWPDGRIEDPSRFLGL